MCLYSQEPVEDIFDTTCPRGDLAASLLELPQIECPAAAQVYCPDSGPANIRRACSNICWWALPPKFLMQQVQGGAQEYASSQVMLLLLVQGAHLEKHQPSTFRNHCKRRMDDWFGRINVLALATEYTQLPLNFSSQRLGELTFALNEQNVCIYFIRSLGQWTFKHLMQNNVHMCFEL